MTFVKIAFILTAAFLISSFDFTGGNPTADLMGGFDFLGVCIRNCAQCKKMYGAFFEGQMCAESCVKFKGKIIPDCEDINSIGPFLTKFE